MLNLNLSSSTIAQICVSLSNNSMEDSNSVDELLKSCDLGIVQKIMEEYAEKLKVEKLSSIILPDFNEKQPFEAVERCHKGVIKLLHPKQTSKSKKSFPKTREQRKNTIPEKLYEVYVKSHRRNTFMKQNNFRKKNFLEELVIKEELQYLTLEILPQNTCYFLINYKRIPANIQGLLYRDIGLEMLSVSLYKELLKVMSKASTDINNFLFDYNIILNVKEYLSSAVKAEPFFSCFILLKPTNMLLIKLANTSKSGEKNKPPDPDLESLRKESDMFYKLSGPLYLETNPLAMQFNNFLKEHHHQFSSFLLNWIAMKEKDNPYIINIPLFHQRVMKLLSPMQEYNLTKNSLIGLDFKISGQQIESELTWGKCFKDFLKTRPIVKIHRSPSENPLNNYVLVEVFTIKYFIQSNNKTIPAERYISVFFHKNGSFKFCSTIRLFKVYIPRYPEALFMTTDDKNILDRYIFQVVFLFNQTSTCGLHISYHNIKQGKFWNFFTGNREEILQSTKQHEPCCRKEFGPPLESQTYLHSTLQLQPCCRKEFRLPLESQTYLNAFEYDESAKVCDIYRQHYLINGKITEFLISKPKTPYVLDVYSQMIAQKYIKKPEDIDFAAGCVVQNGNERTAFEAHKFEKSTRYLYETKGVKDDDEVKTLFYPSILQEYTCTKDDFLDGHQLVYAEDMKHFLECCSEGEVRPDYLNLQLKGS